MIDGIENGNKVTVEIIPKDTVFDKEVVVHSISTAPLTMETVEPAENPLQQLGERYRKLLGK